MKKFFILILLLGLTGCVTNNEGANKQNKVISIKPHFSDWKRLDNGLEFATYKETNEFGNNKNLVFLKIDPKQFSFEIKQNIKTPKSVKVWRESSGAIAVINGGFFDKKHNSTGYLKIKDKEFGTKNLEGSFGYTGMLVIKKELVDLLYLPTNPLKDSEITNIKYALQSYPTLVIPSGNKGLDEKTSPYARRSVLAKDKQGNMLLIVTDNSEFTLSELMDKLLELNIDIEVALNLDGGSSTGLSILSNNFTFDVSSALVPNVILIKK